MHKKRQMIITINRKMRPSTKGFKKLYSRALRNMLLQYSRQNTTAKSTPPHCNSIKCVCALTKLVSWAGNMLVSRQYKSHMLGGCNNQYLIRGVKYLLPLLEGSPGGQYPSAGSVPCSKQYTRERGKAAWEGEISY